ncbi:TniB family NTP-binding protein [Brevundimonas sp. SL130]|uniref:TniB family NTP-binding protein n=1 Tax=Brevundimonas sp. SL130 TaxID=2995143 RepID=UPI00226D0259|nr:TniB family NTP-binding protein [Brevundimonas sp. SL130]WAC59787.1 TniB family NTP-binding protein [Brevundimonas sp. SL130]
MMSTLKFHSVRSPLARESTSGATNRMVAERIAQFRTIFVPYPLHVEFHSRCDYLMELGRATKGQPQRGMRVLAPSGSGKTTAAQAFIRDVELRDRSEPERRRVMHVSLDRATTVKKFYTSILHKFGDSCLGRSDEITLKYRALGFFEQMGCELLFIDEVQHMAAGSGDVTDSLKSLLDLGAIPIVFLGTEEAGEMFARNLQFNARLLQPCDFPRLRSTLDGDQRLLRGYWERLDAEIVRQKLISTSSGLFDPDFLSALHTVADGVIGRVSRLTESALEIALRRGHEAIQLEDFHLATERWALPQGFVGRNPFAEICR